MWWFFAENPLEKAHTFCVIFVYSSSHTCKVHNFLVLGASDTERIPHYIASLGQAI